MLPQAVSLHLLHHSRAVASGKGQPQTTSHMQGQILQWLGVEDVLKSSTPSAASKWGVIAAGTAAAFAAVLMAGAAVYHFRMRYHMQHQIREIMCGLLPSAVLEQRGPLKLVLILVLPAASDLGVSALLLRSPALLSLSRGI